MTRRRVVVVGAFVAAFIVVAALIVWFPDWRGWTAVASLATLLAVVVALVLGVWGDELKTWGRSPSLSLTTLPVPDHFQRFQLDNGIAESDVRISVKNDGRRGARNVELWAEELQVKNAAGSFERDHAFMGMNLKRTHVGDTVTPMLHRGIAKPYDLLTCFDPVLQIAAGRSADGTNLLIEFNTQVAPIEVQPPGDSPSFPTRKPAGTYRLVIAIAADDAPVLRQTVEIVWSGKWSDDPMQFFTKELRVSVIQ